MTFYVLLGLFFKKKSSAFASSSCVCVFSIGLKSQFFYYLILLWV